MRFLILFVIFFLSVAKGFAAFDSAKFSQIKDLRILRITPEGEDVEAERQIVIQFNRPVVPIGDMDRKDVPIEIQPQVQCQWRWLNTSALSCNLDEKNALKSATHYKVTIKLGIKAEDGQTIPEIITHEFTTKRPDIEYAYFKEWRSPGSPIFSVIFNQPVTSKSVEESLQFLASKEGEVKKYAIIAKADPKDPNSPNKIDEIEARRLWLVESKRELPADQNVILKVSPGLVSEGPQKGIGDRAIEDFHTFPKFSFIGIKCYTNDNDDQQIIIIAGKPETQKACNPMRGIALVFSSPVLRSQISKHLSATPSLFYDAEDNSRLEERYQKTYDVLFTDLKPNTSYHISTIDRNIFQKAWLWIMSFFVDAKPDLRDEFDRILSDNIDITFKADDRKPNYKIVYNDAVLEAGVDSEVPIYVNNLTQIKFDYKTITSAGASSNLSMIQNPEPVRNIQFAIPLKVREILGGKSGAVYGYLSSDPNVKKSPRESRVFAQVTPYQVHVKLGHFNSAAWVVEMATGKPVEGARVTIYKDKLSELSANKNALSQAFTSKEGIALLSGMEKIDPELSLRHAWNDQEDRLFVRVDKGKDMALMPISNDYAIDSFRLVGEGIYDNNKKRFGHLRSWGTTAQGFYHAGDVIQYKFYVRNQNNNTLTAAPKGKYNLQITDPTNNVVNEVKNITLNNFGAYSGEFTVSKQAPVGWYQFRLKPDFVNEKSEIEEDGESEFKLTPIRVLVSDFATSPFHVSNQLNGDVFGIGQKVKVMSQAKLHSGGAYTDANVRVTAIVETKEFVSKNPLARDFTFGSNFLTEKQEVFQKIDPLDNKGENSVDFDISAPSIFYGRLMVESAIQDDRGKYVASQSYAEYAGVTRFVGLRIKDWIFQAGQAAKIDYIVVNKRGNPVDDTKVEIKIEKKDTKATKVKGAGNAYLTEFVNSWSEVSKCNGKPENNFKTCDFTPKEAGIYRITAKIDDTKGESHVTVEERYVTGKEQFLWSDVDDNSLELVPEKTEYNVGDKARYLVKNPYPKAKALVTIERYGVIKSFVQTLDGSAPIIEFPIEPDYIPGVYLSVVVFSPRVDKPLENQVDLGKPAFKIGYSKVTVKDPYKEVLVTAKANREVYKPRDQVSVAIHAEPRFKKQKKEPLEFAVAVLDEAVFDLVSGEKDYFNPYNGLYKMDGLDLQNYSLLTRLIGRQKFEKKGANPGGDGGSSDFAMRNLFKYVSYWNPSIKADENGNANIKFEAPDNLTGWRILVMAVTPSDRVGLGDANFKVNRPTEIHPVMPNQVVEGDNFEAGFSVMNRTDKKRNITVKIDASGDFDETKQSGKMQQQVSLEPYKRTTIWMPLQTKTVKSLNDSAGEIKFRVTAGDEADKDGLENTLIINRRKSFEMGASYGDTTENNVEESIKFPDKIRSDIGDLTVVTSPTVIGNVDGAFRSIRDYPFDCWEQKLTKALMASHYKNLGSYMPKDFIWKEANNLPDETLKLASNYQAPNGGMTYFVAQDQRVDPYLSAYTALAFNWLKKSGYKVPQEVEQKLHDYLENFLRQDNYPDFYNQNMAASVRAVALSALAENDKITFADLERYRTQIPQMSLFGKAYFLNAAMQVKGGEVFTTDVSKMILASSNQSGGKFTFSEEITDGYQRILSSALRNNCAILSVFVKFGEKSEGKDLVSDVPTKLVRMITQARGNKQAWENTQENIFCMNALIDYARIYEKTKPQMKVVTSLDNKNFGKTEFSDFKDEAVKFVKNIEVGDVGKSSKLNISRNGEGRLYYATRLNFVPLKDKADYTNSGIEIRREYSVERNGKWEMLKFPAQIKQSELVRVDIFLSLPTARNFVVVNDPVPGGLEPINRDLATASVIDGNKGEFKAAGGSFWFKFSDWNSFNISLWSFYHKELRHDSVRFYSDYLSAGNYHLSYTAQAIAPGDFVIMPIRAEEMYDPDVFGQGVFESLKISRQ